VNRWSVVVAILLDPIAAGRRFASMLEALPFLRRVNWCGGEVPPINSHRFMQAMYIASSNPEEQSHE